LPDNWCPACTLHGMTWLTGDLLALVFGVLGLIGGAVGFFRAVHADKQAVDASKRAERANAAALDAQRDVVVAQGRIADANERIAKAIEIMSARPASLHMDYLGEVDEAPAELRALLPEPEVKWVIEERSEPDTYRLRNAGSIPAHEVGVSAVPHEHSTLVRVDAERPSLEPGAAVVVRTERRLTLRVKELDITWRDDTSPEMQRASVYLP